MEQIRSLAQEQIAIPVIFGYQDKQRPKEAYAVLSFLDEQQIGLMESFSIDETTGQRQSRITTCLTLSFDVIAENPYEKSSQLASMWSLSSIQDQLLANGISFKKSTTLKNTTIILDEKWTSRISFESCFYITHLFTETQQFIEEVKINGINQ